MLHASVHVHLLVPTNLCLCAGSGPPISLVLDSAFTRPFLRFSPYELLCNTIFPIARHTPLPPVADLRPRHLSIYLQVLHLPLGIFSTRPYIRLEIHHPTAYFSSPCIALRIPFCFICLSSRLPAAYRFGEKDNRHGRLRFVLSRPLLGPFNPLPLSSCSLIVAFSHKTASEKRKSISYCAPPNWASEPPLRLNPPSPCHPPRHRPRPYSHPRKTIATVPSCASLSASSRSSSPCSEPPFAPPFLCHRLTFPVSANRFIGVADLASVRFSLPSQLLEPTPNLEYWNYLDAPNAFIAIGTSDDPVDRMLEVCRFWFTKDLKYAKGKPCKPYNSCLGEFFRVSRLLILPTDRLR